MTLLTPETRALLRANADRSRAARAADARFDPVPLVKLFDPMGAATWLATELDRDGDTLFGLADLGCGCPELGSFSLGEIEALRRPWGFVIEADSGFRTHFRLSVWAAWSRRAGSILWAETLLNRVALARTATGLPDDPDRPDGGGSGGI